MATLIECDVCKKGCPLDTISGFLTIRPRGGESSAYFYPGNDSLTTSADVCSVECLIQYGIQQLVKSAKRDGTDEERSRRGLHNMEAMHSPSSSEREIGMNSLKNKWWWPFS